MSSSSDSKTGHHDAEFTQEAVRNEAQSSLLSSRAASRAAFVGEEADKNLPHAPKQPPLSHVSQQSSRSSSSRPSSLLEDPSHGPHDLQEPPHDLQEPPHDLQEPPHDLQRFSSKDVLVGTGTQSVSNEGTMLYRELVDRRRVEYSMASNPDKQPIAQEIIDAIHNEDRRFYRKTGNLKVHLTEERVLLNVVQGALRDRRRGS